MKTLTMLVPTLFLVTGCAVTHPLEARKDEPYGVLECRNTCISEIDGIRANRVEALDVALHRVRLKPDLHTVALQWDTLYARSGDVQYTIQIEEGMKHIAELEVQAKIDGKQEWIRFADLKAGQKYYLTGRTRIDRKEPIPDYSRQKHRTPAGSMGEKQQNVP